MTMLDTKIQNIILKQIKEDERILAAYMNGSRCNTSVKKDRYQDFDLVYVVKETASFYNDFDYMSNYGEIAYLQCPEATDDALGKSVCLEENYGWLVQYKEGHRIDLHVQSLDFAKRHIHEDSLCIVLIDKGNYLPQLPSPSEQSYYVQCPSEIEFLASCNEFWWCLNNVAKGLARGDLLMVLEMHHNYLRKELLKVLSYEGAYPSGFKINIGKFGNRIYQYLDIQTYEMYLATFTQAHIPSLMEATYLMIDLFDKTSRKVAALLSYSYNQIEADASRDHFEKVVMAHIKSGGESWSD